MARRSLFRWKYLLGFFFLAVAAAGVGYVIHLDFRVRHEFEGRRFALPARIYARPLELHAGLRIPQPAVEQELRDLGFRDTRQAEPGWFARTGDGLEISLRPFVFWDGKQEARRVRVAFQDGAVASLKDPAGADVALARVEPQVIGGIYPANNEDRILVRLAEVPKHLIDQLLAVEDHRFYSHAGFDLRGLARAAWSSATGRLQGGSTLTQQLVKNFFLTPERTITRKLNELVMAILLERHYGKQEILETYLNEIYLGQDRDRAIHGIGLASQYYFGKQAAQLTIAESALLVGIIKGPGVYSPHRQPQRALERRNLVLREARDQNYITAEQFTQARATRLGVREKPSTGTSPHPAFVQLVHRQLRRDYDEKDLRSEGLRIFTTLDPRAQGAAERALTRRLAEFEKSKRFGEPGLEGAVVVTDPQSGEVQAMVGGKDTRYPGFNRALDAARPVGSLLKPVIYLTALSDPARYTLVTPLDDGPFVWKSKGAKDWKPENYDKKFHGNPPLRTALAHSYNTSAARLGTGLGVEKVLENVKRLGVERAVQPYASSLLGAVDMSPLEVAQMYQTIASGGFRSPLRAIREVTTQDGTPLNRYALATEQAFPPEAMYLLAYGLQDVVREGTAAGLKQWVSPEAAIAGKTGTTDEQRDAWFAGFSGDRLAVVWVGYDDNRAGKLSGGATAVPVWGELMAALSPEPLALPRPESVELVAIDPQTGLLGNGCPAAQEVPFVKGSGPVGRAPCAGGTIEAVEQAVEAINEVVKPVKSWLDRLFGR